MSTPQEVQAVKDALDQNPNNLGVGIIHEPTGQIHLRPFDDVPGGHAQLASDLGFPLAEVKGFIIGKSGNDYQVINASHLNNLAAQGATGSLQMPDDLFQKVLQGLSNAGF